MLTLIFRALIPQAKLPEAGSLKEVHLNGGNQVRNLSNPRQPGMAAACRTHLITRCSSSPTPYVSVHLEFLSLPAPGGMRCSKAPWKNVTFT